MEQWWERLPPTNVGGGGFNSSLVPYVGWVCCWFSSFLLGFFSRFSGFPPCTKTNISKFQFDRDRGPVWNPAKAYVASSLNIIIKKKMPMTNYAYCWCCWNIFVFLIVFCRQFSAIFIYVLFYFIGECIEIRVFLFLLGTPCFVITPVKQEPNFI